MVKKCLEVPWEEPGGWWWLLMVECGCFVLVLACCLPQCRLAREVLGESVRTECLRRCWRGYAGVSN